MKIPFNKPPVTGNEITYIQKAISQEKTSAGGEFTAKCQQWLEDNLPCARALLTSSCTHALEICALLAGIGPGDEVIVPSFTFVSTTNAFALRGANPVFVDIRPDTMNINEDLIEEAVSERTKAIVPVHYAGVPCNMDRIMTIAGQYNLVVIEDAAQSLLSTYRGKGLGTIGHLGCFSFHETKNYSCGEGGALVINDTRFAERAEIIREKGTDRSRFLRGEVDKYTWVDLGSSYLMSEISAAFLFAQLEAARIILEDRMDNWQRYHDGLQPLSDQNTLELPVVPEECRHNATCFYIKVKDTQQRASLMGYLRERGVSSSFHYIPLHNSSAGIKFGRFHGSDRFTTKESARLLRLPLFYGIKPAQVDYIVSLIRSFYEGE